MSLNICASCSNEPQDGVVCSRCARCKNVAYCGPECQAAHWPQHKLSCKSENFILKICLCPTELTDPPIHRTLSCPANATFASLHTAIQTAFEWANNHCYDFVVKDHTVNQQPSGDLLSTIENLGRFHSVENADYGERLNHLRIVPWTPGERGGPTGWRCADATENGRRVHSRTPELSAGKTKLSKVFGDAQWSNCPFEYLYDFGDHWDHCIEVIGRQPSTEHFVCKEGSGHGVAEDVGSDRGWTQLIKAYRAASPSQEQRYKMQWYEKKCPNGDPTGLKDRECEWDIEKVNKRLEKIKH